MIPAAMWGPPDKSCHHAVLVKTPSRRADRKLLCPENQKQDLERIPVELRQTNDVRTWKKNKWVKNGRDEDLMTFLEKNKSNWALERVPEKIQKNMERQGWTEPQSRSWWWR